GDPSGKEYVGPRAPKLPQAARSMTHRQFAIDALTLLGARVTERDGTAFAEEYGLEEPIHFEQDAILSWPSTLYAPGSPAFERVVRQVVATGIHHVEDRDIDPEGRSKSAASVWLAQFGISLQAADIREVRRQLVGKALLRIRATVAHDAYERLVE